MIVDNLTKFNQKKKLWMTPKHPMYIRSVDFKILYGAAILIQAEIDSFSNPLNNFELERLLVSGLHLEREQMAKVLSVAKEEEKVYAALQKQLISEREKYLLLLDMINVSLSKEKLPVKEKEHIEQVRNQLKVNGKCMTLIYEFSIAANREDVTRCREILHRMHLQDMELTPLDMKYYIMRLWGTMDCTQQMLVEAKEVRIAERCQILEDLVLTKGMRLIFDHCEVRIHGNILLNGGELIIEDSKVIRKGDSHRACFNMKSVYSRILIDRSEMDCRNLGMLVRAEAGNLLIRDSLIYQTTRGAAIRFWGNAVKIVNTTFYNCYSPEDGGAIMIRTPEGEVTKCRFRNCEARRGGAVFGVEGNKITHCVFEECCVAEYGAAIFYHGFVRANMHHLRYKNCCPEGAETVQYLAPMATFHITGEYHITVSTIIDCPVIVETEGNLVIENANIYLNYSICCRGGLQMKNVHMISTHLKDTDMIILEHSRNCRIHHCEFNGMCKTGGISASGSRIMISNSLFRNMSGGRAIYDAFSPDIRETIFNYCEKGAVFCQNGEIKRCVFVNCRAKNGAGVSMYGTRGVIEQCNFRRCIADHTGGAVDRMLGQRVIKCTCEDCKPNDIS